MIGALGFGVVVFGFGFGVCLEVVAMAGGAARIGRDG